MGTINFLAVDDHSIIIAGLTTFIESMMDNAVIDSAMDPQTAIQKIHQHEYDLLILDANTLAPNPFEAVINILSIKLHAKILIFSVHDDNSHHHPITDHPVTYCNKNTYYPLYPNHYWREI